MPVIQEGGSFLVFVMMRYLLISKLRPSLMGTQNPSGEKAYRDLKFPRHVGLWGEILSINMKQKRFGMCLNRFPFFEEATISWKLSIQSIDKCSREENKRTFLNTTKKQSPLLIKRRISALAKGERRLVSTPRYRELKVKSMTQTDEVNFFSVLCIPKFSVPTVCVNIF